MYNLLRLNSLSQLIINPQLVSTAIQKFKFTKLQLLYIRGISGKSSKNRRDNTIYEDILLLTANCCCKG
jgi:hypothetical protein